MAPRERDTESPMSLLPGLLPASASLLGEHLLPPALARLGEASPEAQRQLFQGVPSQSELLEPGRLVRRGKLKEEAGKAATSFNAI